MQVVWLIAACFAYLTTTAAGALPNSFVALPEELGTRAPARLVFSASDLAQCWNDATARRCVLRGEWMLPVTVDCLCCSCTCAITITQHHFVSVRPAVQQALVGC